MALKTFKRIPFCPVPVDKALVISRRFNFLAQRFSRLSPHMDLMLKQAKIPLEKIEYLSVTLFSATFMSLLMFFIMLVVSINIVEVIYGLLISVGIGGMLFAVIIIYLLQYPKLFVKKRVRDMERNLIYGLKHILIQMKSGVPMFKSFVSLSQGGYGALSEEFGNLVKAVQTGGNVEDELDRIAIHNPSLYLRRAIWQISNGIKAGSDMSLVLNSIIENVIKEQALAIRRYGSQLNPLTLVYMMVAVIIPALGITMLIVLSSFSGMTITETMLWGILGALTFLQFMYIGLIKSKRPNM
jgi:flagellar protein FlaJ